MLAEVSVFIVLYVFLTLQNSMILIAYYRLAKNLPSRQKQLVADTLRKESMPKQNRPDDARESPSYTESGPDEQFSRSTIPQKQLASVVDSLLTIKVIDTERLENTLSLGTANLLSSLQETDSHTFGMDRDDDVYDYFKESYIADFPRDTSIASAATQEIGILSTVSQISNTQGDTP